MIRDTRVLLYLACAAMLLFFPNQASARYDPALQWCTVQTDNFIIYYPKGHELLAQRVLSLCGEVHKDVTGYLGVEPRPCPIVLDPETDIFNGFMGIFPNRISLYETPLYTVRGFGPGSDLMDLVFTHEYTHYVHITTRLGWYGGLTTILGDGLAISNVLSPGWILEGITTNTETMFTDGGRGRSPLFKGEMMSFTEGQGLWSLNSAAVSSPYAPPGGRIYLAGYHMVEYMNRTYGQDTFARLSRYQAQHPLGGTAEAMNFVTGISSRQFYLDFLSDYLAYARSTRDKALSAGLPQGKVILADERTLDSFESHFWTDTGTVIGLRRGYDRKTALVEVDPDTGKSISRIETGILANLSARRLSDGRLLIPEVFYHPLGEGQIDTTDLVIFDPKTKKHERLTNGAHIYSACLSPDKKTFVATRRNGMWIDLVLLDADGTNLRPLISKPGMYFDAPCWSPDGSRIAAVAKSGRNSDIVLVDPAAGAMDLLFATDICEDNEPEFSPDGKWLVFSSDRSGIWNIYAWDLENKRLFQLTSVPYLAGDPHISPDGKDLSYSNTIRGVKQVCTLPFTPQTGKPVPALKEQGMEQPDLKRLQPDVAFAGTTGIPLQAYKPFVHIPYFSSDEKGTQAGVLLMGADPVGINTYTANLLYGFESNRAGYDINLTNKSYWPILTARLYDTSVEGNTVGDGKDYWFREKGGELSAGVNMIPQLVPSTITSSLRIGGRLRYFSSLDDEVRIADDHDRSVGVFSELKISRKPDTSPRDMVSSWGEDVFLSYEKGLSDLGGEMPGYNGIASATQYVPSCFTHQGLALTLTHQAQNGLLYYSKDLSIPRGYHDDDAEGDLDKRKNLLLSAEYHFPIIYTDDGLGLYAYHSDLLKGSLFVDYGAGWDGGFDWDSWNRKARTSIGATLTNRCVLMAVLPIEFGIQAGYKTHEKEGFVNFIFKVMM
jgi:Tol biopolymer transport system component